jgi:hypothetical protein
MSNKQFTDTYLDLVEHLMDYIVHNGKGVKSLPKDASFVAFSSTNNKLNKYSQQILDSLKKEHEDKPIVKAEEQPGSQENWKFTTITP